jgi:hypothetical protein
MLTIDCKILKCFLMKDALNLHLNQSPIDVNITLANTWGILIPTESRPERFSRLWHVYK